MNPSFFFIENLKIKFQKRYVLYSSGNLNFPICTCILMKVVIETIDIFVFRVYIYKGDDIHIPISIVARFFKVGEGSYNNIDVPRSCLSLLPRHCS
jgi:hypothetical protein